ncbi:hypothetical protein pipiens_018194, partial [Culex pipiens pipiens]
DNKTQPKKLVPELLRTAVERQFDPEEEDLGKTRTDREE